MREELKGVRIRKGEEVKTMMAWMREIGTRRRGRGLLHRHMHTPNANEYPTFVIEMDGLPPVPFPFSVST